jgi:hypothetical protein
MLFAGAGGYDHCAMNRKFSNYAAFEVEFDEEDYGEEY